MIKKRGKRAEQSGSNAKAKKKSKKPVSKKKLDSALVLEEVIGIAKAAAVPTMVSVVDKAKVLGDPARAKFIFDVGNIHPESEGGAQSEQDEKLVQTLLNAFDIPLTPLKRDEEEAVEMEARGGMARESDEVEQERDCRTCPVTWKRKKADDPAEAGNSAEAEAGAEKVPVE